MTIFTLLYYYVMHPNSWHYLCSSRLTSSSNSSWWTQPAAAAVADPALGNPLLKDFTDSTLNVFVISLAIISTDFFAPPHPWGKSAQN